MASFALLAMVGFYYLTQSETERLRQRYYDDSSHIAQIVRDQFFEVYRDVEDASLFISQLVNELVRLEGISHVEVYDRYGRLSTQTHMENTGRPEDYSLHSSYAEKVAETGKDIHMEHIPERIYEVVAPLFMAGDEHGGKPIGAVTIGIKLVRKGPELDEKAKMLTDIIQLAVGKSASHLEIERLYVDSITRRLGNIKGLASLIVYDNGLKVMAHSEPGHIGEDASGDTVPRLRQVLESHEEQNVDAPEEKTMLKYIPIVLSDEEGEDYVAAVVEMSVDLEYIEGTVGVVKGKMSNVALAIICGTMLAIWWVLRGVVVRPIMQMAELTEAVARGDLDVKVERRGNDELGQLAESFNKMTDEIRDSRDELVSARNFNQDVLSSLYESLVVVSNEGHVMMVNEAAGELLGYTVDELSKVHVSTFLPVWDDVLSEARVRGIAVFSEREFVTSAGRTIPVSVSASEMSSQSMGEIFGFVIVASDISDRKRAEDALREYTRKLEAYTAELVEADQKMRESEERFRLAFETGPDPIMLTRMRDGKYVDVNNGFVEMMGYPKEEVIGRSSYKDISLWPDREARDSFLMEIEKVGGQKNMPMPIVLRDGSARECLVSVSVFELGGEAHLLTLIRDISELKSAQRDRDILNEQLIEKNRELEQLVYVSSHDLRSPLVNVHGFSREVEMDFDALTKLLDKVKMSKVQRDEIERIINEDIPPSLSYIKSSISKMDQQLKGLLKLSRLGRTEVNPRKLDMEALVHDVINNFSFRIKEENVKVEVTGLPACVADEGLVFQAVSNIVDNALKYMEVSKRGRITVSGWENEDRAVYCIRDNGMGIRRDYQEKVFEIFHRLTPNITHGEGLGLSIVQKAVTKTGGKIWLESEEGKGSRFYISLPVAKA